MKRVCGIVSLWRSRMNKEELIAIIKEAFRHVDYPGDWCLRRSSEGDEPYLLQEEFKGKDDWTALDAKFLEQAPDGFGTALSFLSDEAFHFYLPAYMICEVKGEFESLDVWWYLCHGLKNSSQFEYINPKRYGNRTWYDAAVYKFSMFDENEVRAIIYFLEHHLETENDDLLDSAKNTIKEALECYWYSRIKK